MKRWWLVLGGLLLTGAAPAQTDWSEVEIKSERAGGNVYMLSGRGGNMGLFTGEGGAILIDDQFAPLTDKILAAIGEITDREVRFLINTHIHPDHTGGNENFGRRGATIVAHDHVRKRLAEGLIDRASGERKQGAPDAALPIITFSEAMSFHLNGEEVRVFVVPKAHTDGDSFIHFTGSNVLHLGDVFRTSSYPFIDRTHGGSWQGSIDALDRALEIAGPDTAVIPGHGELSDREGVKEFRDLMVTIGERVQKLIDEGATVEEVIAARPTAEFDERWDTSSWNTVETILRGLYQELATP